MHVGGCVSYPAGLQLNPDLPFLDQIVSEALAAGAKPYSKPSEEEDSSGGTFFKKPDDRSVSLMRCCH